VFNGMPPSPSLLRRLAPAFGLHAADLFAIAGLAIPDDLAPLDPTAGSTVLHLVHTAMSLPPDKQRLLRQLAASLPQEKRTQPVRTLTAHQCYLTSPDPGAILMRMLANRNLSWSHIAKTFGLLTRRYWSASTYGRVGLGRKELTPDLLLDLSTLLNIPADDLAVLTDITLLDTPSTQTAAAAGIAELIWDVRRLTADQVQHVSDTAKSMRR
jgi:transcriptional regulator with XRE-family HTH domain